MPLAHELGVFDRALKFLLNLRLGQPVRRLNWTMTVNPRLDTSPESYPMWGPDRAAVTAQNVADLVHLRVELQGLWRLPRSNAVLFGIRCYLISVRELATIPKWARRVHRVLKGLHPALVDYKGLDALPRYGRRVAGAVRRRLRRPRRAPARISLVRSAARHTAAHDSRSVTLWRHCMALSWRHSALADRHRALGSKLEDWNGMGTAWTYAKDIAQDHVAIRTKAGLMDVSGLKKLHLVGPHASAILNYATTRDVTKIYPGQVRLCLHAERCGSFHRGLHAVPDGTERLDGGARQRRGA